MFIKSRFDLDDVICWTVHATKFLQYTRLDIPEFRDTLIQHMESVKKSIGERAQHKMEYESRVNERQIQTTEEKTDTSNALDASSVIIESNGTESKEQDTSSRSGNDAHVDDADIRPIYDEEPMAEVQMTADDNVSATGQQHTEQPEFINEGEVDQNAEQCHDTCPLPAKLTDDKTTELSNQSSRHEFRQDQNDSLMAQLNKMIYENDLIFRQPTAFKSERPRISKPRFASQVDVNNDLSKPVTTHYLPKRRESAPAKPHHMIAPSSSRYSSNDIVHNHYLEEAKKKAQEHSRNSRNFSDSKHFVCSTCQKCVFNANHDSCVIKFLKEVNSRAKVPSNKTITRNKPVEQTRFAKKPERQIPKGHRFSIKNTSVVHKKTMTPRSCLKWKKPTTPHPDGCVFKNMVLRWLPTGKTFASSTTKVESEPPNGSNADITKQCESKQALNVSAGTLLSTGLVLHQMTSDHNRSELECTTTNKWNSQVQAGSKVVTLSQYKTATYTGIRVGITIPPSNSNAEDNSHKVVRLGINPMIQPEPEDLPKDNPKLEIAVLSNDVLTGVLKSLLKSSSTGGTGLASKVRNIEGNLRMPMYSVTFTKPLNDKVAAVNEASLGDITHITKEKDPIQAKEKLSFASVMNEQPLKNAVKIKELRNELSVNGAAMTIPIEAVEAVNARFINTFYGYFIGDRLAFPLVENYVK
ncbi:hypothetical protein Tco_0134660, partial [Tanacetum coccineum]